MPGENDLLSREAYQTFCKAAGNRSPLPWDDLPPLIQDAWKLTVLAVQEGVSDEELRRHQLVAKRLEGSITSEEWTELQALQPELVGEPMVSTFAKSEES